MARENLDELLGALREQPLTAGARLDGLESGVWARIEESRRAQAPGLRVQVAVAMLALALGAAVGATAERRPVRSEAVVLSEDANLAPSVAVEGGA